jgi:hypothetical protein
MGRPPIGKRAMSAAERQRRHRAQFRDSKPVTKPAARPAFEEETIDGSTEQRWQFSFANLAGDILARGPYWAKNFAGWESFSAPSHIKTLVKEAAAEFASLAALIDPSVLSVTKPAKADETKDREIAALKARIAEMAHIGSGALKSRDREIAELKAEVKRLSAELARAKKMLPPLSPDDFSPARKATIAEARKAERAAAKASRPPKPPRPQSEIEQGLRNQIRSLRSTIRYMSSGKKGSIFVDRADRMTVNKCLHPDAMHPAVKTVLKEHPGLAKQYEQACQIFNSQFTGRKAIEI